MLKVEQYGDRKVATRPLEIAAPREPVDQYSGLIKGVDKLSVAIKDIEQQRSQLQAEEALQSYIRDTNDLLMTGDNAYYSKRGKDAVEQSGATIAQMEKLRNKYLNSVSDPKAHELLRKSIESRYTSDRAGVQKHSMTGQMDWDTDLAKTGSAQVAENIRLNIGNKKRVTASSVVMRQQMQTIHRGADAAVIDYETRKAVSGALANGILDEIDRGNTGRASAMFDDYYDQLGAADRDKVQEHLKDKSEKQFGQAYVDDIMAADLTMDQALAKARKELDGDREDDVISRIKIRYNEQETIRKNTDAKLSESAWAKATTGKGNIPASQILDSITVEERRALGSGFVSLKKFLETDQEPVMDWNKHYEFFSVYQRAIGGDQQAKEMLKAANFIETYRPYFDDRHYDQAMKLVTGLWKTENVTPVDNAFLSNTAAVDNMLSTWFGKKSKNKWSTEQRSIAGKMYSELNRRANDWSAANGNKKMPSEVRDQMLYELARDDFEWTDTTLWFDSTGSVSEISSDDLDEIVDGLINKGIPVTGENINKVWNEQNK